MAPVRRLPLRFKSVRWERLPNCVEIVPVMCLFRRNNSVTRELETVTPSQAVMRVVVTQFRRVPCRVSLAASSMLHSLIRSAGSGSGIALVLVHKQNGSPRSDRSFSETLLQAVGIHPLNWLPAMFNLCSLEKVPIPRPSHLQF